MTKSFAFPVILMLLLGSMAGCKVSKQELTAEQTKAVTDTVNLLMDRVTQYADKLNIDSSFQWLSQDSAAIFMTGGLPYSHKEFLSQVKSMWGPVKRQDFNFVHSQVKVLSADAAIWIAYGKTKVVSLADEVTELFLCETFVWQRSSEGWKIIHFHESILSLPSSTERALVEAALGKLAKELESKEPKPADIPVILTNYLKKYPVIYGATLAFAPAVAEGKNQLAAPYVCRNGNGYRQVDLLSSYDYTLSEWYSVPVTGKVPCWSNPYFDDGGGGVVMVTYSIPLCRKDGSLIGVLTSDLELK